MKCDNMWIQYDITFECNWMQNAISVVTCKLAVSLVYKCTLLIKRVGTHKLCTTCRHRIGSKMKLVNECEMCPNRFVHNVTFEMCSDTVCE